MNEPDFGVLTPLVKSATVLMAAAAAVIAAWKGRSRWEPGEDDIPGAPQRIAGVLCAAFIAVLWWQARPGQAALLQTLALLGGGAAVAFFLLYFYLIAAHLYVKEVVQEGPHPKVVERRLMGGFQLTPDAQKTLREKGITVQKLFKGTAYEEDAVWERGSRALARVLYVASYIGLIVSGTVGLAAAALLLGLQR